MLFIGEVLLLAIICGIGILITDRIYFHFTGRSKLGGK